MATMSTPHCSTCTCFPVQSRVDMHLSEEQVQEVERLLAPQVKAMARRRRRSR